MTERTGDRARRRGPTIHRRPTVSARVRPTLTAGDRRRINRNRPAGGGPVAGCSPWSCHHTAPHATWTPEQVASWHGGRP